MPEDTVIEAVQYRASVIAANAPDGVQTNPEEKEPVTDQVFFALHR